MSDELTFSDVAEVYLYHATGYQSLAPLWHRGFVANADVVFESYGIRFGKLVSKEEGEFCSGSYVEVEHEARENDYFYKPGKHKKKLLAADVYILLKEAA